MDLVLEVLDYAFLDKLYANLLPKSMAGSLPEAPAFVQEWAKVIDNGTKAAIAYSEKSKLHSLIAKTLSDTGSGSQIYGLNAPYHWFGETVYTNASLLPRYSILRQSLSLAVMMSIFGWLLYFSVATFSFIFVYDKTNFNHPRYLKNQMSMEIKLATEAIPVMVLLTLPWFLSELHGYSFLYYDINESTGGWKAFLFQIPADIMFTDAGIYFLHRWLHWPLVYKYLHKKHHKWIVCTPYASHAFNPIDGYFQSLPYHWYPFLFPLHKVTYLFMFTFVNFWTVMIHDGQYLSEGPIINGAACHTVHHLYFNYDYGQFTTLWDRLGGTYRKPDRALFDKDARKATTWAQQAKEMDQIRQEVEGDDNDRIYGTEEELGLTKQKVN
ncbi:DEKNAAC101919 [Brettanomyces naardenensis]|uniref:DEKNAAC101919 n=1 Tax=Brettanomyces naardenensis TaxID=13370 RepID=A0A448YJM2_BRENA|nr:DEKNAAC101919 [Brettanomyces naardenensis]